MEWRGIFLVTFFIRFTEFIFESETQTRFSLKSKTTEKQKVLYYLQQILVKFFFFPFRVVKYFVIILTKKETCVILVVFTFVMTLFPCKKMPIAYRNDIMNVTKKLMTLIG